MQGALTGDIPLDDPRVLALPPEARQELERLLGVRRSLEQQGVLSRALEAEVQAQPAGPVPVQVERFLREHASQRSAPRLPLRRALALTSIAAGALLLIWVAASKWQPRHSQPTNGGTLSGAGAIEPIVPVEREGGQVIFRWHGELPARCEFVVHVFAWDSSMPGDRGAERTSGKLRQNEWRTTETIPDRIFWRVDTVPMDGSLPRIGKTVLDPPSQ